MVGRRKFNAFNATAKKYFNAPKTGFPEPLRSGHFWKPLQFGSIRPGSGIRRKAIVHLAVTERAIVVMDTGVASQQPFRATQPVEQIHLSGVTQDHHTGDRSRPSQIVDQPQLRARNLALSRLTA